MNPNLLLVVANRDDYDPICRALPPNFDVLIADSRTLALRKFRTTNPSAVIVDLHLGSKEDISEGMATVSELLAIAPGARLIVIGPDSREIALDAIAAGAHDFLQKPLDEVELKLLLKRTCYVTALEHEYQESRQSSNEEPFEGMLGASPPMRRVFESIRKFAATDAPVLLLGESGTGKDKAARAIHQCSARADGPFVAINCSAIPQTLVESELFGHERNAYTGAHTQRKGRFEFANGGTIFLDEIGEIPSPIQIKLLRFLQDMQIVRVGGNQSIRVDARIVAATNADLQKAVSRGTFREDLYYRLAVIKIVLPPLRARENDIRLLSKFFLDRFAAQSNKGRMSFERDAWSVLNQHSWPGNVRELENCIRRAVIMARGQKLGAKDLPIETMVRPKTLQDARKNLEREMVEEALRRAGGRITPAAKDLGLSRGELSKLCKRLGCFGHPRDRV